MIAAGSFALAAVAVGFGILCGCAAVEDREGFVRVFLTLGLLFAALAVALASQS